MCTHIRLELRHGSSFHCVILFLFTIITISVSVVLMRLGLSQQNDEIDFELPRVPYSHVFWKVCMFHNIENDSFDRVKDTWVPHK